MPAENLGQFTWSKWQRQNATASGQIALTTDRVILKGVIVHSHSSGTFKFFNGTLTSLSSTGIGGTYTPAAGSSSVMFEPMSFDTGLFMMVAGTFDGTVLFNTLP